MKVKFIRNTIAGKQYVKTDDVVDLHEKEAKHLILMRKAVAVDAGSEPQVQEAVKAADELTNSKSTEAAPEVETASKPKKKGK